MKPWFLMAAPMSLLTVGGGLAQTPTTPVQPVYFRSDSGHTGYTPGVMPTPLSLLWRHTTAQAQDSAASPIAANGTVYFGCGPKVYALRTTDGIQKWQFSGSSKTATNFGTTPMLVNGFLYIGSDDGRLYKLNAETGVPVWVKKVDGPIRSSPVVEGDRVYFGSADNNLYALNTDTGDQAWAYQAGASITTAPIVSDGQVVFACTDNKIYNLSAVSGRLNWTNTLPSDPSTSPPVLANGTLYTGAGDTLYALSQRSGGLRWSVRLQGEISSAPTVGGGLVYLTTEDKKVYGLSIERGRVLWTATLAYPGAGPPLLTDSILLIPGQRGVLYGYDAQTGTLKWQYVVQAAGTATQKKAASTDVEAAPLWADKTLYVLSDDGTLSTFRADAVDNVGPQVADLSPTASAAVSSVHVPYYASLIDVGSGINPATVTLSIDGAPIGLAKYDPSRNAVSVDLSGDVHGDANRALTNGRHQMLLQAQDWRGNSVSRGWSFLADSRKNPKSAPALQAGDFTGTPAGAEISPSSPVPVGELGAASGGGSNNTSVVSRVNDPSSGPPPPPPLDLAPPTSVTAPPPTAPPVTTEPTPPTEPTQPTEPAPPTEPTDPTPPPQAPGPPPAPTQ